MGLQLALEDDVVQAVGTAFVLHSKRPDPANHLPEVTGQAELIEGLGSARSLDRHVLVALLEVAALEASMFRGPVGVRRES